MKSKWMSADAEPGGCTRIGSKASTWAQLCVWSLFFALFPLHAALAVDVDYSKASVEMLVDDLALIDSQTPGIDSSGIFEGFIADGSPVSFSGGVLGAPRPQTPPQMRELVRRGISALPTLIAHLNDDRSTKLSVGNDDPSNDSAAQKKIVGVNYFMFTVFSDEYDSRMRYSTAKRRSKGEFREFKGRYTVKIGDVCYALIGQIVNRHLLPVRYQPSAGLVVNSPIETPALVEWVKSDWGAVDAKGLNDSLLADIRQSNKPYLYEPALVRLRFYYPDTYSGLQGEDLRKKKEFEGQQTSKAS